MSRPKKRQKKPGQKKAAQKPEQKAAAHSADREFRLFSLFREKRKSLLFIFLLTFVIRFIYVAEISRTSPYFDNPVVDAEAYYSAAKYIKKTGDWLGEGRTYKRSIPEELMVPERAYWVERPYWQAPLYFYFLGFIFKIFGISFWLVLILQVFLSAVSCVLLYAIAAYFFSYRVAFISGIVFSLYGTLVFFSGELLVSPFFIFIILWMFYYLLVSLQTFKPRHWMLFSLFFSLGVVARSTILMFLPVVIFWLIYSQKKMKDPRPVTSVIILVVVISLLFPFLTWIRNTAVTKEKVIVSTNTGINLFIGNNDNWLKTYKIRPGHKWNVLVREPLVAGNSWLLNHSAQNDYFMKKSISWMKKNPVKFVKNLLEKTYYHFHGYELIRNVDLYHLSGYSVLLSLLMWRIPFLFFPFGLLSPLFLVSLFFLFQKDWKRYFLLTSFLIIMSAVIVVFFPTSRYRVQIVPFFIMAAVFGAERIFRCIKEKKWNVVLPLSGIFVLLLILLNLPKIGRTFDNPIFRAANAYMEGVVYYKQKNYEKAIELFKRTVNIDPRHEDALSTLGLCYAFLDNSDEAGKYFLRAYEVNPNFPKNIFNLGIYYQRSNQWEKALRTFEEYLVKEQAQKIDYALFLAGQRELERCKARLQRQTGNW
jgi:4-amino-4-deoxy-L-arabinose transferase-like glycosyltransferase